MNWLWPLKFSHTTDTHSEIGVNFVCRVYLLLQDNKVKAWMISRCSECHKPARRGNFLVRPHQQKLAGWSLFYSLCIYSWEVVAQRLANEQRWCNFHKLRDSYNHALTHSISDCILHLFSLSCLGCIVFQQSLVILISFQSLRLFVPYPPVVLMLWLVHCGRNGQTAAWFARAAVIQLADYWFIVTHLRWMKSKCVWALHYGDVTHQCWILGQKLVSLSRQEIWIQQPLPVLCTLIKWLSSGEINQQWLDVMTNNDWMKQLLSVKQPHLFLNTTYNQILDESVLVTLIKA